MNKKLSISLAVLAVLIVVGIVGITNYVNTEKCWESPDLYLYSSNAVFSVDGNTAFIILGPEVYQMAAGICALPGGRGRTLHSSVDVYSLDLKTLKPTALASWPAVFSGSSDPFTFTHKSDDMAYAVAATSPRSYIEINLRNYKTRQISSAEYSSLTNSTPTIKGSYDVTADGRFIEIVSENGNYKLVENRLKPQGSSPRVEMIRVLLSGINWLESISDYYLDK